MNAADQIDGRNDMTGSGSGEAGGGVAKAVGQGILVLNARQRIVLMNGAAKAMLRPTLRKIEGQRMIDVLAEAAGLDTPAIETLGRRCLASELLEDEFPITLADGAVVTARLRKLAGRHRALFLDPKTAKLHREGDSLTGLADRAAFVAALREALAQPSPRLAVLALDLGRFKAVNETLGHVVGDTLLRGVADRLREALRQGDVAARLGGDEFAIMTAIGEGPDAASDFTHRLVRSIGRSFLVDGHHVNVDARAGVALVPEHGGSPDVLIRSASLALRHAKQDGTATRTFEEAMYKRFEARRELEIDLRQALARDQFELHYQPLISLACDGLSGFEALIRWRHPKRGLIPPNDFIPIAEEIGLIADIGTWVVREACQQATYWPRQISVSVNASSTQVETGQLVPAIVAALGQSGLSSTRLEVEVTESAMLRRADLTLDTLHRLRGMGVRIAMDDFGTGYSSLTQLHEYPFDKLKIDRSFVSRLGEAAGSVAIVRAIARMSASLGLRTVAEGVETHEQLDTLRAEGCDEVQGYLLSRPVPPGEIDRLLCRFGAS